MGHKVIAIDGPAGSGKSTTARLVAAKLGFIYLDTGAMYRSVTLLALRQRVSLSDEKALEKIAAECIIEFAIEEGVQKTIVNREDVSEQIRSPEVTAAVSEVSANPGVRRILVERQRQYSRNSDLVTEGRDTTSVVFRDAFLKVYLIADVTERARRRLKEFESLGKKTSLEEQLSDIRRRDEYDSSRQASPLTRTPDSVVVDTTALSIEEQVGEVVRLFEERLRS